MLINVVLVSIYGVFDFITSSAIVLVCLDFGLVWIATSLLWAKWLRHRVLPREEVGGERRSDRWLATRVVDACLLLPTWLVVRGKQKVTEALHPHPWIAYAAGTTVDAAALAGAIYGCYRIYHAAKLYFGEKPKFEGKTQTGLIKFLDFLLSCGLIAVSVSKLAGGVELATDLYNYVSKMAAMKQFAPSVNVDGQAKSDLDSGIMNSGNLAHVMGYARQSYDAQDEVPDWYKDIPRNLDDKNGLGTKPEFNAGAVMDHFKNLIMLGNGQYKVPIGVWAQYSKSIGDGGVSAFQSFATGFKEQVTQKKGRALAVLGAVTVVAICMYVWFTYYYHSEEQKEQSEVIEKPAPVQEGAGRNILVFGSTFILSWAIVRSLSAMVRWLTKDKTTYAVANAYTEACALDIGYDESGLDPDKIPRISFACLPGDVWLRADRVGQKWTVNDSFRYDNAEAGSTIWRTEFKRTSVWVLYQRENDEDKCTIFTCDGWDFTFVDESEIGQQIKKLRAREGKPKESSGQRMKQRQEKDFEKKFKAIQRMSEDEIEKLHDEVINMCDDARGIRAMLDETGLAADDRKQLIDELEQLEKWIEEYYEAKGRSSVKKAMKQIVARKGGRTGHKRRKEGFDAKMEHARQEELMYREGAKAPKATPRQIGKIIDMEESPTGLGYDGNQPIMLEMVAKKNLVVREGKSTNIVVPDADPIRTAVIHVVDGDTVCGTARKVLSTVEGVSTKYIVTRAHLLYQDLEYKVPKKGVLLRGAKQPTGTKGWEWVVDHSKVMVDTVRDMAWVSCTGDFGINCPVKHVPIVVCDNDEGRARVRATTAVLVFVGQDAGSVGCSEVEIQISQAWNAGSTSLSTEELRYRVTTELGDCGGLIVSAQTKEVIGMHGGTDGDDTTGAKNNWGHVFVTPATFRKN